MIVILTFTLGLIIGFFYCAWEVSNGIRRGELVQTQKWYDKK